MSSSKSEPSKICLLPTSLVTLSRMLSFNLEDTATQQSRFAKLTLTAAGYYMASQLLSFALKCS